MITAVLTLCFATALVAADTPATVDPKTLDGDVAIRAMRDEMDRTVKHLRLENADAPFIVSYALNDGKSFVCNASFGALTSKGDGDSRSIGVEVRVGDYTMDNTNFSGGFGFGDGAARVGIPKDDSYDAIRHRLWLATDQSYKGSVEQMAAKKAWLKTNNVPDHPGDLQKVEPVTHIEAQRMLTVDKEQGIAIVKALSALFRDAPKIQGATAGFAAVAGNETMLSSEGFFTRKGETWARVTVTASTQADDGMPLGDLCVFYARTAAELPSLATMTEEVKAMIARLTALAAAPRAEEYIGPVLFEGDSAGFAMLELLIDRLTNPHEPLGAKNSGSPFKNRLKKRVAPPFFTVVDDPMQQEFGGQPLLGAFQIDDDGVPTQKVSLIEEGRLKSWYMSRIPTRAVAGTNGHSRGGIGSPGCVFVNSSNGMPREKLRAELMRIAKEQELPYAIRVESIARADVGVSSPRANGGFANGTIRLSAPIAAYRVYPDGHEELLRGGDWQGVTLRTLRDIYVTGDQPHVLNTLRGGGFVSIVCPDLLVEEIEMKKPAEQEVKRPYLEHPFFAHD